MDPGDVRRVLRPKAEARRAYDRMSAIYDGLTAGEAYLRRRLLRLAAPQPGEITLDLGAGTGAALPDLARGVGRAGRVVGLDLSPGMLVRARTKIAAAGPNVHLVCADSAHLPIPDSCFDLILISFALELFDTPEIPGVLSGCGRALRPSGRLVVGCLASRPRRNPVVRLYEWLHDRFPVWLDCRPIPVRQFVAAAGFRIERLQEALLWGLPVDLIVARPSQGGGAST